MAMFRGSEDAQTKYGGRKTHVMYSADLQRRSSRVWCPGSKCAKNFGIHAF